MERIQELDRPSVVKLVGNSKSVPRPIGKSFIDIIRIVEKPLGRKRYRQVVRRVKNTLPQGTGGGGSRRENVRGAFAPVRDGLGTLMRGDLPGCAVRGGTVLLVDDVMSTGATLDACGNALREAGSASVLAAAAAT